jgi:hypothetical protein
MELRNGKILSQPRNTQQRIAWEDKKQQISAAEDMVKLFDELRLKKLKKVFQQLRDALKIDRIVIAACLGWEKFTGHKPTSVSTVLNSSAGIVGWAKYYKKTKTQQQLSIYDRWHMDSEISGRL